MDFKAFIDSLSIMGNGMLSIFVVMIVVYGLIFVLSKLGGKKKDA